MLQPKKNLAGMTSGRLDISTMKNPKEIKTDERLQIFDSNEAYESIKQSISEGFDKNEPIVVGKIKDEEIEIVVDGNNRLKAALENNLEEVPVTFKNFENIQEAIKYAYKRQSYRRNLTSADLLKIAELYSLDEFRIGTQNVAEAVAKMANVSKSTAKKVIYNANNATEEEKEDIKSGKETHNSIYNKHHPKKAVSISEEDDDEYDDEVSEELEDDSGNPAPISLKQRPEVEPKFTPPTETETDRWLKEKNIQVDAAKKEGYKDGFYKGLVFALGEILNGKTPKEVYNDERIQDLSTESFISSFEIPEEDYDAVMKL